MSNNDFDLDEKIATIADYVGRDFMRLARDLKQLQDAKPDAFIKVVEALNIGRRRAFALARVARIFDDLGIPDARLNRIGWTKLNKIASYLDEGNAAHLLNLAGQHTVHELDMLLKGEKPVDGAKVMLLYLPEADHDRLSRLLIQHGAQPAGNGGLSGKEEALMKIVGALSDS